MKKKKIRLYFKPLIIVFVFLLLAGLIAGYLIRALKESEFFVITDVITRDNNLGAFAYLKGKNIFRLNLEEEAGYILRSVPDCSTVRLVRVLPNRIFIDFIKRRPLAVAKLYKDFALDEKGVLFDISDQVADDMGLPFILGLETKIFGPKSGVRYNIKEVQNSLDLIKRIENNNILNKYKIIEINVREPGNLLVKVSLAKETNIKGEDAIIELRLPDENFQDEVTILASLFAKTGEDLASLKYIDLRFKEPVIRLKNDK